MRMGRENRGRFEIIYKALFVFLGGFYLLWRIVFIVLESCWIKSRISFACHIFLLTFITVYEISDLLDHSD